MITFKEFNEQNNLSNINKKWFKIISYEEFKSKEKTLLSGKPTKVWKDIIKRFFQNKWNIVFLIMMIAILIIVIFGSYFNSFDAQNPVSNKSAHQIRFMKPSWLNEPKTFVGTLKEFQSDVDNNVAYDFINNKLLDPENIILSSQFSQSSGLYEIVYKNPSYVPTILGTDEVGIDVWQRLIVSAQWSFLLAISVATIEGGFGVILGMYLGYHVGKKFDTYFMRLVEILSSIPALIFVVIFVLILGSGIASMMISLILIGWIGPVWIARMFTIKMKNSEFIMASISLGASQHWIIFRHILPNILGRLLVSFVHRIPYVIFLEATFVFLGIKVGGEYQNTLGNLINKSRDIIPITNNPMFLISTVTLLISFTISLQIFANGVRDAFDPKIGG